MLSHPSILPLSNEESSIIPPLDETPLEDHFVALQLSGSLFYRIYLITNISYFSAKSIFFLSQR